MGSLNRLLAETIDRYSLYQLHKKRSKDWHFSNTGVCPGLEELDHFYFKPQLPRIDFEHKMNLGNYITGNFKYKSEVENDKCNEYAAGVYYENKSVESPLNVILVHGWRQSSLNRIKAIYLKPFMDKGYNMYFFTLPYHIQRYPEGDSYNGEHMISANVERTLSSVRQAVVDLRALIGWVKNNRRGKIALIGLSLGGLATNLTGAVEEGIDGLISVFALNELAYGIWNTIPGRYIKRDFEINGFSYEQLQSCWRITDASRLKPKIPKANTLLLTAKYDKYIGREDADKLWEAWDKPERKIFPCGHSGIALCKERIAESSIEFIKRNIISGG